VKEATVLYIHDMKAIQYNTIAT